MLNDCIPASTVNAPLIPNRRVNYEFGMVLGVNDFRQVGAHFGWKNQLSNRLLHGYGTVAGLGVTAEGILNPDGVQIRVGAGYAISPQGRWIWLENDLCARLEEWVRTHRGELSPPPGPGPQVVYVTLCYDECPTELVPVAGKACASEQDTRVASRVEEAYQVRFEWNKPEQHAEDSMRDFGELLGRVIVAPQSSPPVPDDRQRLFDAVLHLAEPSGTPLPPGLTPDMLFVLEESAACEVISQALALWTTRVHPTLLPPRFEPFRKSRPDCLLLACIEFNLDAAGEVVFSLQADGTLIPGDIQVADCDRPILVPNRLKQELFCLVSQAGAVAPEPAPAPPPPPPPAPSPGIAQGSVTFNMTLQPGEATFSPNIDNTFGASAPVMLSVARPRPTLGNFPPFTATTDLGLSLTVFEVNNAGRFRIGVTNNSQRPVDNFIVNWFALQP